MTLPVVVLVLTLCLGALSTVSARVLLINQASQAARRIAAGNSIEETNRQLDVSVATVEHDGTLVCVQLVSTSRIIPIEARACALDYGL